MGYRRSSDTVVHTWMLSCVSKNIPRQHLLLHAFLLSSLSHPPIQSSSVAPYPKHSSRHWLCNKGNKQNCSSRVIARGRGYYRELDCKKRQHTASLHRIGWWRLLSTLVVLSVRAQSGRLDVCDRLQQPIVVLVVMDLIINLLVLTASYDPSSPYRGYPFAWPSV